MMIEEFSAVKYWQKLPDRDEALEAIYGFLNALSNGDPEGAMSFLFVRDMPFFEKTLHDTILKYLELIIEDEEWEELEKLNLAFQVTDPGTLSENQTQPEFSGRHFVLEKDETVSVLIGVRGEVTPIRLHFSVVERDELFYLRLHRITVQ